MNIDELIQRVNIDADNADKSRRVAAAWSIVTSGIRRWEGLSTVLFEQVLSKGFFQVLAAVKMDKIWWAIYEKNDGSFTHLKMEDLGVLREAAMAYGAPNGPIASYPNRGKLSVLCREILDLRLSIGVSPVWWAKKLFTSVRTVEGWELGRTPSLAKLSIARGIVGDCL